MTLSNQYFITIFVSASDVLLRFPGEADRTQRLNQINAIAKGGDVLLVATIGSCNSGTGSKDLTVDLEFICTEPQRASATLSRQRDAAK